MRSVRLLTIGALSAALILPAAVTAGGPFAATLSLKAYTNVRTVPLTAGKVNVPSGKTVNAWYVSETGAPDPTAGQAGWKNVPTNFKLDDADGAHTVYIWARATGGVVSDRGQDTTFLDRVAPTVDLVTTVPAQAEAPDDPLADRPTISSRNVSISFDFSDPGEDDLPVTGSGVAKYAVVNGTTAPISSSTDWKAPTGDSATVAHKVTSGNGNKTVSIFVRDRAGNVSLVSSTYFKLALAGPVATLTMGSYTKINKPAINVKATPGANTAVAGFFLKVTADADAPDAPTAGAAGWKVKPTVVTLPSPGFWYVWAWAKDDNGSVSALPAMDAIWFDAVAPTGTLEIDEVENGSDVDTTTDRVIDIDTTYTDGGAGSGVVKYAIIVGSAVPTTTDFKNLPIQGTVTLPLKNNTKTVNLYLKDAAGNISAAISDTVIMTIPAPTMTVNAPVYSKTLAVTGISRTSADPGGTGIAGYMFKATNSAPLATDAGWTVAPTTFTFSAGEGNRTLYAWVKDNNGSVSAVAATDVVFIDTVKPTAVMTASGTTLTLGGSDGLGSGVAYYALVKTSGAIPGAPAYPNSAVWKSTTGDAISTISVSNGDRVTLFVRDNAGWVSDVDTTGPDVNSLVIVVP